MHLTEKENRRLRRAAKERKRAEADENRDFTIIVWLIGSISVLLGIGLLALIASGKV